VCVEGGGGAVKACIEASVVGTVSNLPSRKYVLPEVTRAAISIS
jgi:hypothetical protein